MNDFSGDRRLQSGYFKLHGAKNCVNSTSMKDNIDLQNFKRKIKRSYSVIYAFIYKTHLWVKSECMPYKFMINSKVPLAMELGRELGDWLAMALVQEKDPQFRCKKPTILLIFLLFSIYS